MAPNIWKPRVMRGFLQDWTSVAKALWGVLIASVTQKTAVLGCYVLLVGIPGALALRAVPQSVSVSPGTPIRLEAIILREFPGSHLLTVEPAVYHKVPADTITLRTPQGSVWRAEVGLNQVTLGLSRIFRPTQAAPISIGAAEIRARSNVGGGQIVSYRTQGHDWIFTIAVQTQQSFLVTVNRQSGRVLSVKDS